MSKTYKGIHEWDKQERGRKDLVREHPVTVISRPCPPIVSVAVWEQANRALHLNHSAAMAHVKNNYLLRSLVRCGCCHRTLSAGTMHGKEVWYRCPGRNGEAYSPSGKKCQLPMIRGADLEAAVWAEIEVFLAKPGAVVRQLEQNMKAEKGKGSVSDDIRDLEASLARLDRASDIAYRQVTRGLVTEQQFDKEVESIKREKVATEESLSKLRRLSAQQDAQAGALGAARSVLESLRLKADEPLGFERKRRIVEALVEAVTVTADQNRTVQIIVRYAFEPPTKRYESRWRGDDGLAATSTGMRSCRR